MSNAAIDMLERLRNTVRDLKSVLVAYSGGVDSALVMAIAHEQLGARSLACIGVSPSYPARERRAAIHFLNQLGAAHRLIEPREHANDSYRANAADRCYFCKAALFAVLQQIAKAEDWNAIADGTHCDDVGDHTHGMRAAGERGIRSPLLECGFTKAHVRDCARQLGLPVWNKPAMACLASRIPRGVSISPALLRQVESAEDVLAELGFEQFRVRHHGEIARIELPAEDIARACDCRAALVAGVQAAGYAYVTIDLAGFRMPHPSAQATQPTRFVTLNMPSSKTKEG